MSSQLWVPGRPPMCTTDLLWLMGQLIEELQHLVKHKDGAYLSTLDTITDEVRYLLSEESEDCLHTDVTIRKLLEFFETLSSGIRTLYDHQAWEEIVTLGATTMALRDELAEELARFNNG